MKNYTITVNGNVYEVTVEEGFTGKAQLRKQRLPYRLPRQRRFRQQPRPRQQPRLLRQLPLVQQEALQ